MTQERTKLAYQAIEPALESARWQDVAGGFVAEIPPPPRWVDIVSAAIWLTFASFLALAGLAAIAINFDHPRASRSWHLLVFLFIGCGLWISALRSMIRAVREPQRPTTLRIEDRLLILHPGGTKREENYVWAWDNVVDVRLCPKRFSPRGKHSVRLSVEVQSGQVEDVFIDSNGIDWVDSIEAELRRHLCAKTSART